MTVKAAGRQLRLKREGDGEASILYYLKGRVSKDPEDKGRKNDLVATGVRKIKKDVNVAHRLLGHVNERYVRLTAAEVGWELTGTFKACEACAKAKAKAKGVAKTTNVKAEKPGERLFVDISGPYRKSVAGSEYWILVVDDYSRKKWSYFSRTKSKIATVIEPLIDALNGMGNKVKFLRCDNAGENVKHLKTLSAKKGITTEFTAPYTPQQNGVVEMGFVTIRDGALSMMLDAKLTDESQGKLWAEAVYTMTRVHNGTVTAAHGKKSHDEVFYGTKPQLYNHMVEWGRLGYVKLQGGKRAKLTEKSTKCMCLGYAENHSGDTYRVYNLSTKRVMLTRDVKWMEWHGIGSVTDSVEEVQSGEEQNVANASDEKKDTPAMTSDSGHGEKKNGVRFAEDLGMAPDVHVIPNEPDSDDEMEVSGDDDEDPMPVVVEEARRGSAGRATTRLERELRKLGDYNTPGRSEPIATVNGKELHVVDSDEETVVAMSVDKTLHWVFNVSLSSTPGLPRSYKEALKFPDADKWEKAIEKEIANFEARDCWDIVDRVEMPEGRVPLKTRWIFVRKNEQDGSVRHKARLVVKGYDQIPGLDYTESFSPVASDVAIRTVLAVALYQGWSIEALDVEAAFLNAEIEELVFMEIPEGFAKDYLELREKKVAKLKKAVYGTVQAPRAWMKTFASALEDIGFERSKVDPCLFFLRDSETGEIAACLITYVDDAAIVGKDDVVTWIKQEVSKRFGITDLGVLTKHLGVWYERKFDYYGEYLELSMNDFLRNMMQDYERVFGKEVKEVATPGYPGTSLVKRTEDEEVVNIAEYRSLVGKLLWYVKKVAPECTNAVRELSGFMDGPTQEHWRAIKRVFGYLKSFGGKKSLKLRKPKELRPEGWVDSDYATNKDTRRSVSGFVMTVGGALVSWVSRTQKSITLSSTEAEFVALSLCATEAMFVDMLLEELVGRSSVEKMLIHEDNTGAIFLVNNDQVGQRTKHIDVRYKFVQELVANGRMKVVYVKSEENYADVMTKNVKESIHGQLAPVIVDGTFMVNARLS